MTPIADGVGSTRGGRRDYSPSELKAMIRREVERQGGDPNGPTAALLIATADQESGFDEFAVGDGGHSKGLYQFNDEGAGAGKSDSWLFNPWNQIRNRVREFLTAGATTGADAAAIQRPAEPGEYAKQVDAKLGKGGGKASGDSLVEIMVHDVGSGMHLHVAGTGGKSSPLRDRIRRELESKFGLRHTSGDRSPESNAAAGGVANSNHLTTSANWADDYVGSRQGEAEEWLRKTYGIGKAVAGTGGGSSSKGSEPVKPGGWLAGAERLMIRVLLVLAGLALVVVGIGRATGLGASIAKAVPVVGAAAK